MTDDQIEDVISYMNIIATEKAKEEKHPISEATGMLQTKPFGLDMDKENPYSINMSSIYTILIQNAGRFVENYASDLLIHINRIESDMKEKAPLKLGQSIVNWIAMRESGVDHDAYIANRLTEYENIEYYYRRVCCVVLYPDETYENEIKCKLIDTKHLLPAIKKYIEEKDYR